MPIARGVLTGKFRPTSQIEEGHRALNQGDRLEGMLKKAEDLRVLSEQYEGGMTRMAHHFCLTPSAVSAIIPGARTSEQLTQNVAASNGSGLPADILTQIQSIQNSWG